MSLLRSCLKMAKVEELEMELAEHLAQQAKKPITPEEKEEAFMKSEEKKEHGSQARTDVQADGHSSR